MTTDNQDRDESADQSEPLTTEENTPKTQVNSCNFTYDFQANCF